MKVFGAFLVLVLMSAFGGAQAACGGGGWHSSTSVSSSSSSSNSSRDRDTAIVSSSESRHIVATTAENTSTPSASARSEGASFSTSRFDSVAPRLNLSQKQVNKIEDAKAQLRSEEAQRTAAANAEFDRRLHAILNQDQLATYLEADAGSSR